jgi:homoserine kinase type II
MSQPTATLQTPTGAPTTTATARVSQGASGLDEHEVLGRDELVRVMSHYDVGPIDALEDFPRGSRKAPKLVLKSKGGRYLLKRRAKGRGGEDQNKVAFCHALQEHLAGKGFPLPHLIPTRADVGAGTMLVLDGKIYELFEYIPGETYGQSLESTFDSGRVLSLYHTLLDDFTTQFDTPTGSYHAAPAVEQGFDRILKHFAGKPKVAGFCRFLLDSYLHARDSADDAGLPEWPGQIVHGDWHPGNMLFRQKRVVAVIDYDSARRLPRVIDSANGALQFSILGGGEDLESWPEYLDESRFKRFLRGYDEVSMLSEAELTATPWLMIEALIAEAVYPIAATGNFGKLEGIGFLKMVQRKVVWLQRNADRLVELVGE